MKVSKIALISFILISKINPQCVFPRILIPFTQTCFCYNIYLSCTSPLTKDDQCKCACPAKTCESPKVINQSTCECECPVTSCNPGQVPNTSTCACECPNQPTTNCGFCKKFDDSSCSCVCKLPALCLFASTVWDEAQCKCVKITTAT